METAELTTVAGHGRDVSAHLARLCHGTLERNWREGTRAGVAYSYTAPSTGRYPWQWYWDSCFSAIAWRRLDSERARAELETLLAAATPEGFIGHTIFWGEPLHGVQSLFYDVRTRRDYDPYTGSGMGATNFSWSALIMELAEHQG